MEATKRSGEIYRLYAEVLNFYAKPVLGTIRSPQRVFLSATLPLDIRRAVEEKVNTVDAILI